MPKSKTSRLRFYAERFRKQEPSVYNDCCIMLHIIKRKMFINGNN